MYWVERFVMSYEAIVLFNGACHEKQKWNIEYIHVWFLTTMSCNICLSLFFSFFFLFFYTGFQTFFMTLQNASIAKLGMHNWLKNSVFCVSIMSSNMGAGFILNYMWKILIQNTQAIPTVFKWHHIKRSSCRLSPVYTSIGRIIL